MIHKYLRECTWLLSQCWQGVFRWWVTALHYFLLCHSSRMTSPVCVIVVGAGSRGENYSNYASLHPERMKVRRGCPAALCCQQRRSLYDRLCYLTINIFSHNKMLVNCYCEYSFSFTISHFFTQCHNFRLLQLLIQGNLLAPNFNSNTKLQMKTFFLVSVKIK